MPFGRAREGEAGLNNPAPGGTRRLFPQRQARISPTAKASRRRQSTPRAFRSRTDRDPLLWKCDKRCTTAAREQRRGLRSRALSPIERKNLLNDGEQKERME